MFNLFYKIELKDHIRVPPKLFHLPVEEAVLERIKKKYDGFISMHLGFVIDVDKVEEVKEGVIIPGDGASYYETGFTLLVFKPEMQEVLFGKINDIADFGAFINIGPTEGMIHISQTMDDFVSFSKDKVLLGKETKKTVKINDNCRTRVIAVSYKDARNPKLGLTMRQPGLGKFEWIEENMKKEEKTEDKKEAKGKGKKEKKKEKKKKK